ncbi:MAG: phenylalanine--tRNA ligase subunit beta [Ignavibacteria bacterium]
MRISLNWLKEYLPGIELDPIESLSEKLIDAGFDIESIENESEIFNGFVVGEVLTKEKHPNADKLSVCTVDSGSGILNIVCGAPNVDKGQKVCVAMIGAIIPNGGFEIKKSKIRGEMSEGMICSESELNLSENHDGIMVLKSETNIGTPFAEYSGLNDIVLEIGLTPNRGDLLSHFGVAREVAGNYGSKPKLPQTKLDESGSKTNELIDINIESREYCKRFTGRVISNVNIAESPGWLKKRLISVGLRPRNNIVDITNFVMLETGQPLHAFDYDKIRGKRIIVKTAKDGDKFVTLDSKERNLSSESLMVCDAEGYSAIAGVMGGELSEITDTTRNVFLESAYFDPVNIRKNSKRLGLITDASHRFERGVDIDMVKFASLRAASLMQEIAGGEISNELLDVYPAPFETSEVEMRLGKANNLLGLDLSKETVVNLLGRIGIEHTGNNSESLIFKIPESRRNDIQREPDLIEEVARLYGYSRIESKYDFRTSLIKSRNHESEKLLSIKSLITDHLVGRGFNEIISTPLTDVRNSDSSNVNAVRLENSMTTELNGMRTGLSNGLMKIISFNINNLGKDVSIKLFEVGKVFADKSNVIEERDCLIFGISGRYDGRILYDGERRFELSDIKGEVNMLLSKLNLENFGLIYYNDNQFGGIRIDVGLDDCLLGNIYKADSNLLKKFDIESDVYFCQLFLDEISKNLKDKSNFKEISKFPSVKRDIALVVDKSTSYESLESVLNISGSKLLKSFDLIDVYEGEQVGSSKKSLTFSLEFASDDKTLTDAETNEALKKIMKDLQNKAGAILRS